MFDKYQNAAISKLFILLLREPGMRPGKKASASKTWSACFLASVVLLVISRPLSLHSTSLVSVGSAQLKTYDPECTWTYEEKRGGYPPVAYNGRGDVAMYICPSTFRDLADYVYAWPFDRFGEDQVYIPDKELAMRNLPPVSNTKGIHRPALNPY